MALRTNKYIAFAGILTIAAVTRFVSPSLGAQKTSGGVKALQKAKVLERLVEEMPNEHQGREQPPASCSILHGPSRCPTTG